MTRPARSVSTLALALALLATLGCGDSPTSPTPVSQEAADDLAVQMASNMGATSGGLATEFGMFPMAIPTGPAPTRPQHAINADTSVVVGGVTWELSWSFYNDEGAALPGWDPSAVRLGWVSRATGDVDTETWDASLRRNSTFDVFGVQPEQDTLTVDGSVRDTVQSQFTSMDGQRTRYLYCVGAIDLSRVAALKDQGANPYPLSGILAWTVHVERLRSNNISDVEATYDAEVTVAFNGTRYPVVTVARTFRYILDLVTGVVVRLPA